MANDFNVAYTCTVCIRMYTYIIMYIYIYIYTCQQCCRYLRNNVSRQGLFSTYKKLDHVKDSTAAEEDICFVRAHAVLDVRRSRRYVPIW